MCFYEMHKFACNDWKWGNFRQHCQNEYRTGETCGSKLIYQTLPLQDKCPLCERIERKQRRLTKAKADVARWRQEPVKFKCTIEKTEQEIDQLAREIATLLADRAAKAQNVGSNSRRNGFHR